MTGSTPQSVDTNAAQAATYKLIAKTAATNMTAGALSYRFALFHPASAAKTVRVCGIEVQVSVSATAEVLTCEVHRITTAPTGTAVTTMAATASLYALDARDGACETSGLHTIGTAASAGLMMSTYLTSSTANTVHGGSATIYDWRPGGLAKPLILRPGVAEGIAVAFLSTNAPAVTPTVEITFTEE